MPAKRQEPNPRLRDDGPQVTMVVEPEITIDDQAFLKTFGEDLTDESDELLKAELATIPPEPLENGQEPPRVWKPPSSVFIPMQGGKQYLPARFRVVWMRQSAESQGWGILTSLLAHSPGEVTGTKVKGKSKIAEVDGGYALFKATIIGDAGQTIAEGTAMEHSESFDDYYEKAETSAVARALALAGFGTESALEIDEGFIADGPMEIGFNGPGPVQDPNAPINISSASVAGVRVGGRQKNATQAQIDAIRKEASDHSLTGEALDEIITETLGFSGWASPRDDALPENEYVTAILDGLSKLSFQECGKVVKVLFNFDDDAVALATYPDDIGAK